MQKHLTYVLLLMSTLLASAVNATAGVRHVWAVHDGEKVERDARQHPARGRNTAWDGRVVRIFGARNEVIAFQMIVEADESGIRELALTLPSLVSDRDRITYKAPEADPTKYVGRPIQIFAVNYMLITTRSHASWVFDRASPAAPPDPSAPGPSALKPRPVEETAPSDPAGWAVKDRPRARTLLESLAGGSVRHQATSHENLRRTLRDALRERARSGPDHDATSPPDALPREVNETLVLDHLGRPEAEPENTRVATSPEMRMKSASVHRWSRLRTWCMSESFCIDPGSAWNSAHRAGGLPGSPGGGSAAAERSMVVAV